MRAAAVKLSANATLWLENASAWRFLSLCFRLPSRAGRAEIKSLSPRLPEPLRVLAEEVSAVPLKQWEAEFHRVMGAGGVPACASSYDDNALAGRGPMLADIRGFYEAFAYQPEPPPAEVPDHIAVQLDFLAYLAMKVAFARHEADSEKEETARTAYERFLEQHIHTWVERFQARLTGSSSAFYSCVAECLCQRVGPAPASSSAARGSV